MIRDCTFEAGTNTSAIRGTSAARDGGDNALYSPVIECCWCGDASGATAWIDGLIVESDAYTGTIRSCRFASNAGGTHLNLKGRWLVEANSFEDGTVYDTTASNALDLVAIANLYKSVSAVFSAANFPSGAPPSYISLGNQGADDVIAGARLGFFDARPSSQPGASGTTSGFTRGAGQTVDSASTFTGGVGTAAYTVGDIVKALKTLGVISS